LAGFFIPKGFLDHSQKDYDAYLGPSRVAFFVTRSDESNRP
jgi:hypothetical protein